MREIKLRAWKRYGDTGAGLFYYFGFPFQPSQIWWFDRTNSKYETVIQDEAWLKSLDFQQFTGLTDRNGKEIYEGDVVTSTAQIKGGFTKVTYSMVEGKGVSLARLTYALENDIAKGEQIEVIGNIYENPEMVTENFK